MRLYCIVSLIALVAVSGAQGQVVEVQAVSFDSNRPALILTFSGNVDVNGIECSIYKGFIAQNSASNPTIVHALVRGVGPCGQRQPNQVFFVVSAFHFFEIFNIDGLFESNDTSALTWDESLFQPTASQSTTAGTLPVTFIPDTIRPNVLLFEIDLNQGLLFMTFDTQVDVSSVNPEALSLTNGEDQSLTMIPFSPQNDRFSAWVGLIFPTGYLGSLARLDICRRPEICYIFFSEELISDAYGNPVSSVPPSARLLVATFTEDVSLPNLVEFEFDLNTDSLAMTFSEAVNVSLLDVTAISLTSGLASDTLVVNLTGGRGTEEELNSLTIYLTEFDLSLLKDSFICRDEQSCFLFFNENLIVDYNYNPVIPISQENSILAAAVHQPSGEIQILKAEFDHNRRSLFLTFSEQVILETINCDQREFVYQNAAVNPTSQIRPIYPGTCRKTQPTKVEFRLDPRDYFAIWSRGDLFFTIASSFICWSNQLGIGIHVTAGKLFISNLTFDFTPPSPVEFDLDLTQGTLTIFFHSLVDPTTLDFTNFELSDSQLFYTLTGGTVVSAVGTAVCILLTVEDLVVLGIARVVCRDVASCYLTLNQGAVEDIFAIPVPNVKLQVGRLTLHKERAEGHLRVGLEYFGCSQEKLLGSSEPLVLRPYLLESVVSVWCESGDNVTRQLTWERGSLENVVSPLGGESVSRIDFPSGLQPENFGVFVCSWEGGYSENFIVDSSPFIGSPDGKVAVASLYFPLEYRLHYWPERFDTGLVMSMADGTDRTDVRVDVSIADFTAVVAVNATDVVYSLTGDYVAVLVDSGDGTDVSLPFSIIVHDPYVMASESEVEISGDQSVLTLTCTASSPLLPVLWREGEERLSTSTSGVSLTVAADRHSRLTLDLGAYTLSGEDIVCEVFDPEGDQVVAASATVEISLPGGVGVERCESEEDRGWGIEWDTTDEGATDRQNCPRRNSNQQVTGIARRTCLEGGRWGKVDVSGCATAIFSNLQNQVTEGLQEEDVEEREMVLSEVLPVLEEVVTPSDAAFVFPRDLITSNGIVESVVSRLAEDVGAGVATDGINTDVVGVLDKMLAEEHTDNWRTATTINNKSDATLLLLNSESYGQYVALAVLSESVETNDTVTLTEDNIELSAQRLDTADYPDVVYPADGSEESERAQIRIPASHLSSRNASAIVNMRIENIGEFLPDNEEGVVAAPVISSQVVAKQNSSSSTTPVQLSFTTLPMTNAKSPRCVYWSFRQRMWLEDGIATVGVEALGSYSYHVRCESFHLTSFSVLVDIVEEEDVFELTVAGYVGAGVLTGCALLSSTLYIYSLIASCVGQFRSVHVIHLAHLGLSLSLTSIGVLILAGLTEATGNTAACAAVTALLQYFFTAALTWLLVVALLVFVAVAATKPVGFSWKWSIAAVVVGFGLPVIPTAVSLGLLHDDYGNEGFCWVRDEQSGEVLWANAGPKAALFAVALLLILLSVLFTGLRKNRKTEFKPSGILIIEVLVLLLTVLVGGWWAFGLVMVNGTWGPAHWAFMGCGIALGLTSLAGSLVLVCCGTKQSYNLFTADTSGNANKGQYWSDPKPLGKEAGQMPSGYDPKAGKGGADSAYAMMGAPPDDEAMEAMIEGAAQETAVGRGDVEEKTLPTTTTTGAEEETTQAIIISEEKF